MKVLILTCDKYRWLIPVFNYFYKKYWPDNPYQTEIVTEREHIDDAVFYAGRLSWASRLIYYLKQSREDKILFVLEDYLFKSAVDTEKVKAAERLCEGDVGCVRLRNGPHKYFIRHCAQSQVINGFREYPLVQRFAMVAHVAFFQKQFLLDVLKDGENIWQTENEGSVRLKEFKSKWRILWPEINVIDYISNGGILKKGKLRSEGLKWVLSELSKPEKIEEDLFRIIQEKMNRQKLARSKR